MVVLTHTAGGWQAAESIWQDTLHWPATFTLRWSLAQVLGQCVNGVQLFFVVSGFTLALVYGAGSQRDWVDYACRRLARVAPGYWLAGLLYTLAAGLSARLWAPNGLTWNDLSVAGVFGSAWQAGPAWAVVPGGWSVSVEISFYVALPVLLRLIDNQVWRAFALLAFSCALTQLLARRWMAEGVWSYQTYCIPLIQLPAFLCGVAAATVFRRAHGVPRLPGAAALLLSLCIVGVAIQPVSALWMLPMLPFVALTGTTALLVAVHPPRWLAHPIAQRVGQVSYSMYLVHFAVLGPSLRLSSWLLPRMDWCTLTLHTVITAAAAFGLAHLTKWAVEDPPQQWMRAMLKRRSAAMPLHIQ